VLYETSLHSYGPPYGMMCTADKPEETEMAELFLREAILMKDFHHAHVLGVIGVSFDSDGSPMVILPYMANGDLRQYITSTQLVRLQWFCLAPFTNSPRNVLPLNFVERLSSFFSN